ncbi:hypothetical protein P153DRAFT_401645 [Dothidotthia symphoricarpi CBS 119687]|uniref:Kinesin motor domain-containing protein n=1 Tax=Dothidotthia symphoricarpi CBS 119687 TaxID=1392245 RepID=A0A6A5ZZ90_9PLEO|nr:uncharacterized protein P153DRAFT_401645 [Dothidotthia symphoricarpi CBS 119687]KAF2123738.1 hypothetical protein P153DRAFT_401645 [Dothidotthia symphoricarpi CBS 119687]
MISLQAAQTALAKFKDECQKVQDLRLREAQEQESARFSGLERDHKISIARYEEKLQEIESRHKDEQMGLRHKCEDEKEQLRNKYNAERTSADAQHEEEKEEIRKMYEMRFEEEKRSLRIMRWRATSQLLDKFNPLMIMVKVTPQTKQQETKHMRKLDEFTYRFDSITMTNPQRQNRLTTYECDQVFYARDERQAGSTNKLVFDDISHMVDSTMKGRNFVLLAYGATATGKSYTFLQGTPEDPSIIRRAIDMVYQNGFTTSLVCIQDYKGEENPTELVSGKRLRVRMGPDYWCPEYQDGGSLLGNPTSPREDTIKAVKSALKRRQTGQTTHNDVSSRSHALFVLQIYDSCGDPQGILTIVDLAGKENLGVNISTTQRQESEYIKSSVNNLKEILIAIASSERTLGSESLPLSARGWIGKFMADMSHPRPRSVRQSSSPAHTNPRYRAFSRRSASTRRSGEQGGYLSDEDNDSLYESADLTSVASETDDDTTSTASGIDRIEVADLVKDGAAEILDVEMDNVLHRSSQRTPSEEISMPLSPPLTKERHINVRVSELSNPSPARRSASVTHNPNKNESINVDPWNNVDDTVWECEPYDLVTVVKILQRFLNNNECTANLQAVHRTLQALDQAPQWTESMTNNLRTLAAIVLPTHTIVPRAEVDRLICEARTAAPIVHCPPDCVVIKKAQLQALEAGIVSENYMVIEKSQFRNLQAKAIPENHVLLTCTEHERLLQQASGSKSGQNSGDGDSEGNTQRTKPPRGVKKSVSKTVQWAIRFERLTMSSIKAACAPSIMSMLSKSAAENLTANIAPLIPANGKTRARRSIDVMTSRLLFMHQMDTFSAVHMLLMIFFFIETYSAENSKEKFFREHSHFLSEDVGSMRSVYVKLPKLFEKGVEERWQRFVESHPECEIEFAAWCARLAEWRKMASFYVFFATRLGLGSLLWLSHELRQDAMWGYSYTKMEGAFEHLEKIGIPRLCVDSGANQLVKEMIELLLEDF